MYVAHCTTLRSTLYDVYCTAYSVHSTHVQCTVYIVQCTLYISTFNLSRILNRVYIRNIGWLFTIHRNICTQFTIQCTLYSVHSVLRVINCTSYVVRNILYAVNFTSYTILHVKHVYGLRTFYSLQYGICKFRELATRSNANVNIVM